MKSRYDSGAREDYYLSSEEFDYIVSNGLIDESTIEEVEKGFYKARIEFYHRGNFDDLALSFGKSQIAFIVDTQTGERIYAGFWDIYDFDSKVGRRGWFAEKATRIYNKISNGTAFSIYYNKRFFVE